MRGKGGVPDPGVPYFLLQKVLGQWAGRQFLDHQVHSLLKDTVGQASRCEQLVSSWPDTSLVPLNSSGFPETEVMGCQLNYCASPRGLGSSLTPHRASVFPSVLWAFHRCYHMPRKSADHMGLSPHLTFPGDLRVFTRGFRGDALLF